MSTPKQVIILELDRFEAEALKRAVLRQARAEGTDSAEILKDMVFTAATPDEDQMWRAYASAVTAAFKQCGFIGVCRMIEASLKERMDPEKVGWADRRMIGKALNGVEEARRAFIEEQKI